MPGQTLQSCNISFQVEHIQYLCHVAEGVEIEKSSGLDSFAPKQFVQWALVQSLRGFNEKGSLHAQMGSLG